MGTLTLHSRDIADLKSLQQWHLEQAAECRDADEKDQRDFHTWAASLLSIVRQAK